MRHYDKINIIICRKHIMLCAPRHSVNTHMVVLGRTFRKYRSHPIIAPKARPISDLVTTVFILRRFCRPSLILTIVLDFYFFLIKKISCMAKLSRNQISSAAKFIIGEISRGRIKHFLGDMLIIRYRGNIGST